MPEPAVKLWRFDCLKAMHTHLTSFVLFCFVFLLFQAKVFIMSLFHSAKEHLVREIKMMCTYPIHGHFSHSSTSTGGSATLVEEHPLHKKHQIKTVYFHQQKIKDLHGSFVCFLLFVILYVESVVPSYSWSQDLDLADSSL